MESVVRNVVEPFFEALIKRIGDLEKKLGMLDIKMTKIENELLALGCRLKQECQLPMLDVIKWKK